ncbi:flippase [Methanobrevibacter sp.]|uniref:flippase n=1 Tax=Methanobrevibacter sp. TaxID=66852 RepID=UPI00388DEC3C
MVNEVKTVFANLSWMLIAQFITSVLSFFWTILTAQYLGPSEYGIFGTAMSFSGLFIVFVDFGIITYIVRSISTDLENESTYINNSFTLSLLLSIFYLFVVLIILFVLGWDNYIVLACFLYAIVNVSGKLVGILQVSFQAHEQLKFQAITNIINSLSIFVFLILVIFSSLGLFWLISAYIFSNIISFIYVFLTIRKHYFKIKFSFNPTFYKELIKCGIPFAISGVFTTIYYSIDVVMITQFAGTYDAGLYNAAYKLLSFLTIFYSIYGIVIFPVMSKLFEDSKELLNLSFIKSTKYLSAVSIPIAVFTCFYSSDIINIYGSEFTSAGPILNILIWTICFIFINSNAANVLNAAYKEYSVTKIACIAALFNIMLNLVLIPKYSFYGAAVATVFSEALVFILFMHVLKQIDQLPNRHFIYDIIKIIFASGILAIALYFLNLNLWLAMPVSIVVYFAALLILKTPDDQDKLILKQILNK